MTVKVNRVESKLYRITVGDVVYMARHRRCLTSTGQEWSVTHQDEEVSVHKKFDEMVNFYGGVYKTSK